MRVETIPSLGCTSNSFIHWYSALEAGLAGTRAQSCDRNGSGTLHPGQVLGGSLPLLSPAFRHSHFRRQVPVRSQRRERSQQRKVELWARTMSGNFCLNSDFHVNLGIFYMPQIYDMGPTVYFPSEGRRAEDFFVLRIRRLRPGLNPRTWVLEASTLPLDHRSRLHSQYPHRKPATL